MKRIIAILLILSAVLCGCNSADGKVTTTTAPLYISGVWLSYSEVDGMVKSGDFNNAFLSAVNNLKALNITDIFFHTVPFCDAVYKSDIYPLRKGYPENTDILKVAVDIAHKNGMRLHAWINPYRVKTSDSDISTLPDGSVAKKWYYEDGGKNASLVCFNKDRGIYLNPAESTTRRTVISVIREICENYKVDGIHFDDYFYPTVDESFDKASYEKYTASCKNPISLAEYRRSAVNALISGCYTATKFENKNIIFSVSPAASIVKNLDCYYADVSAWCKSGCVDAVIPQLYFGFSYPDAAMRFDNLLKNWKALVNGTETKLVIGIAAYKIGTEQEPDKAEWANGDEVINKQLSLIKNDSSLSGEVFFSYSSLFCGDQKAENVKKAICEMSDD